MPATNKIRKLPPKKGVHIQKSDNKLFELVVLLARRSEGDHNFGQIKLNKLLFYCDFLAYVLLGKPITGQEYFALPNGPALRKKTVHWNKMVKMRAIAVRTETTAFADERQVTLALREPNLSLFTPQELDIAYRVLANCRDMTGSDLSTLTHNFPGWILCREKETIPYPVALVSNRKPSQTEIQIGLEIERSLGLAA